MKNYVGFIFKVNFLSFFGVGVRQDSCKLSRDSVARVRMANNYFSGFLYSFVPTEHIITFHFMLLTISFEFQQYFIWQSTSSC